GVTYKNSPVASSVSAIGATCESPAAPGENGEPPTCVSAPAFVESIENELRVTLLAVRRKFPLGCTRANWGELFPIPTTNGDCDAGLFVSWPFTSSEKMKMSPSVESGTKAMLPAGLMAMKSGFETANGEFVASVSAPVGPMVRTCTSLPAVFVTNIKRPSGSATSDGFPVRSSDRMNGEPVTGVRAPEFP